MADYSPWGSAAMSGAQGYGLPGQGASGAPSSSGTAVPAPGNTNDLPTPATLPQGDKGLPGGGFSTPTGGFAQNSGGGTSMAGQGGLSNAPGVTGQRSQGWIDNRNDPNWLAQHPNAIPMNGGGGGYGGPLQGASGAPGGPGMGVPAGGGGMANAAGNSGLGPLLQLLMGGAGGQGGQNFGGLLQQLMQARLGANNGVAGPQGGPMPQHSQGWLNNRLDQTWLAQHPNAAGTAGTPMPRPGNTNGGIPGGPGMGVPSLGSGAPTGQEPRAPMLPPTNTGAGQQFGNAGIYMGSPIVNALAGGGIGGPISGAANGGVATWNGGNSLPIGVQNQMNSMIGAPSVGSGIPQYSGPPIPNLGPTLQQGQTMANVLGMQNSPNPTLQNMAPLLMQQLLARG